MSATDTRHASMDTRHMASNAIHALVVGAAGYAGGEVLRILLNHPHVARITAQSTSQAGKAWHDVHRDLLGFTEERFVSTYRAGAGDGSEVDVAFLCSGHGRSRGIIADLNLPSHARIIDLSRDFRLSADAVGQVAGRTFQYGLPEHHRERIRTALNIANPGCFATAIQLALLPLASMGALASPPTGDIHVHAVTGSTGAGQEPTPTGHHAWRHSNQSVYKAFTHQHLSEIAEQLSLASSASSNSAGPTWDAATTNDHPFAAIHFIPQRGAFTRGILATIVTRLAGPLAGADQAAVESFFREYYAAHPFTHVTSSEPDLKSVVNTNACHLHVQVHEGQVLITSVIDNLIKGAAGQAVQNMNLMLGFPETAGLRLKASVY
jgi:N-acetyl-gamma-glutamyl-phosphate reductase